ncbi:MOSC domain-containing protein [Sphingomonas sp. MMS24-JH45]
MELVERVEVSLARGIHGDDSRCDARQALQAAGDADRARRLGRGAGAIRHTIPWQERRANLLVGDLDLPQTAEVVVRIGADVLLEITRETDPCERMEALAEGVRRRCCPTGAAAPARWCARAAGSPPAMKEDRGNMAKPSRRSTISVTSPAGASSSARI